MPRIKRHKGGGMFIGPKGPKYHPGSSGKYLYSRNPVTQKVKRHRTGK